jgi:hypothetical protein
VRDLADLARCQIQLICRFDNTFFFEVSQPEHVEMLGAEQAFCMSQQLLDFLKLFQFVGWYSCCLKRMNREL